MTDKPGVHCPPIIADAVHESVSGWHEIHVREKSYSKPSNPRDRGEMHGARIEMVHDDVGGLYVYVDAMHMERRIINDLDALYATVADLAVRTVEDWNDRLDSENVIEYTPGKGGVVEFHTDAEVVVHDDGA